MSQQLAVFEKSLSVSSLGSYVHWANQIPLLTEEEEQDLATRFHEENDLEAARKLVMSHLRFVIRIARGYAGYGLQEADLIQEGNIGLMKAVKRFDPKVGVRLVSFAIHWIRAEIHEFILRNWRIVKIATTKAQRKLFFNLRKASKKLGWLSNDEVNAICEEYNVKEKDVRQMEARMSNYDQSFDGYDEDDSGGNISIAAWAAPANYLEDHSNSPEDCLMNNDWEDTRQQQLYTALESLDERSQDILRQRWLSEQKTTLHNLAAKYDVSAERIRQLEQNAMKKIQEQIS